MRVVNTLLKFSAIQSSQICTRVLRIIQKFSYKRHLEITYGPLLVIFYALGKLFRFIRVNQLFLILLKRH